MNASSPVDEYAQLAPIYDPLLSPFVRPIRRAVCRMAEQHRLRRILDLCCGTGQQSIMLDRRGFQVTGVDLSPAMLNVARSKSPKTIAYYREDAAHLHFEDKAFDGIVIAFSLHEKSYLKRNEIMEEAKRVLTRQGKMLLVDFMAPEGLSAQAYHRVINLIERMVGKEHHAHFKDYMKRGALTALLEMHALRLVQVNPYFGGSIALVVAERQ